MMLHVAAWAVKAIIWAHHDGGHEEASRDDNAAQEDHKDKVGGGEDEEGAQREVAVGALAHLKLRRQPPQAEDVLYGLIWIGQKCCRQIVVLACSDSTHVCFCSQAIQHTCCRTFRQKHNDYMDEKPS